MTVVRMDRAQVFLRYSGEGWWENSQQDAWLKCTVAEFGVRAELTKMQVNMEKQHKGMRKQSGRVEIRLGAALYYRCHRLHTFISCLETSAFTEGCTL